jgi:hypothetical protein
MTDNTDTSLAKTYIGVVVLETVIILALWVMGRMFP